jgi:hypothetical protein
MTDDQKSEARLVGFTIAPRPETETAAVRLTLMIDEGQGERWIHLRLPVTMALTLSRAITHDLDRQLIPGF